MDKITGRQISAARALCGMTQASLAADAGISIPTLKRMEGSEGGASGLRNNVGAVRAALEAAGVVFDLNAGAGPGVRFKEAEKPGSGDHPKPTGPAMDAGKLESKTGERK